jgi:uncharacterized protein YcbK (DUF882 family)
MKTGGLLTRRSIIKAGMALAACSTLPSFAYASLQTEKVRSLHLYNIHTGEALKTVYWEDGVYITDSLKDIDYILRDHRTNDMKSMEPRLLDVIAHLHKRMESHKPFEVISGYRSPRTNRMLYEHSRGGVNPNSLHMYGRAIDIRLHDRSLKALRNTAIAMRQGGVGYYPESGFVHIDTGSVKHW